MIPLSEPLLQAVVPSQRINCRDRIAFRETCHGRESVRSEWPRDCGKLVLVAVAGT